VRYAGETARCGDRALPTTLRTPENGVQPQAAVDAQGVVHLIRSKSETRPRSYLP